MIHVAPISLIERGIRIRQVDPKKVSELAESIQDVGLLCPILVRRHTVIRDGRATDGFILIAGLHRLVAMEAVGATEIAVHVSDLSGPAAIIAECDENLQGPNLSAAERALFTKRRKEAYEALHPETKNGVNQHSSLRQVGEPSDRFTADTASRTGQSERAVQRDATRGANITDEALAEIKGSDLDKGVVLDKIAKVSPERQLAAIQKERAHVEAQKRNRQTDRAIALTEAQQFADWLMERLDLNEMTTLIAWLEVCKSKDVIAALRREAA